jgi:hypothetical protein
VIDDVASAQESLVAVVHVEQAPFPVGEVEQLQGCERVVNLFVDLG